MENRVNRLLNCLRHRLTRVLPVVGALLCVSTAWASNCDPSGADAPDLYQVAVQVRGQNPVRNTFTVDANTELVVFARERGADITLEVLDSSGQSLGRGDNPIRRTGVQRVALPARLGQRFYVAVTGKDHADSRGSVDVRVVDLQMVTDSACLEAQKLMAGADAAYATGQAVTRAIAGKSQSKSSDQAYQEAADGYEKAAARLGNESVSVLRAEAELARATLRNMDVDNYVDAREWAEKAALSYAALHDDYGKARAQAIQSAASIDLAVNARRAGTTDAAKQASAMLSQARDQLSAVAAFHARRHELYDQAQAQNNIGIALYYEGRYDEAIRAYQKSLPLYESLHERFGQAQVLQNVAVVEWELGRMSASQPHFNKALTLIKREEAPQLYSAVLTNGALVNKAMGNDDLALRQLSESLQIARQIQDTYTQTIDIHNIASVYATLGDQTRALDFFRQALDLATTAHNARGKTASTSMRAIANILRQQGQAGEALSMDQEALLLAATPWAKTRINLQIVRDLIELGRTREAEQSLETILSQNAASDEVDRARALVERGRLRSAANDTQGACADLQAALKTFKAYELPTDEFEVWMLLAELEQRRGSIPAAFAAVDQALSLAEEVRLQSANPELRSTLLQPLRPAFDLKISMLFDQYRAAQGRAGEQAAQALRALETAEQARARAQADFQSLDLTAPGLDPELLARRQALFHELATRRSRLEARLDRTGTADSQSRAIRSDIASLRQELDQIDARIGAASQSQLKRSSKSKKANSLPLGEIPGDVAIIEYWLGAKGSFAWVVTQQGITMTPIGPRAVINTEAEALHTALRGFGTVTRAERLADGERLYDRILRPIEAQISDRHTLIFAPDGALHYVPFATLRSTEAGRKIFLVEKYDLAVTPSIQMFLQPALPRPHPQAGNSQQMLLVDDPVYDSGDPRIRNPSSGLADTDVLDPAKALALVRGGGQHLPRLPGAAREAAAIARLMPAGSVDRLDGFAANRERFLTSALDRYRLIHVASHATTDSEVPQASALILSTVDGSGKDIDGRVYAADFMGVRLHADTVVLSACDTALGKNVAGEGLIGLQYIVLARGARSVVSSLWPAMDQVTAHMMVKFYTSLLQQRASVIAAWSAASRETLTGQYPDPGTWGAFMLTLSHVEDVNSNTKQSSQQQTRKEADSHEHAK
jgi:CHAT domain-containing protein